MRKVTVLVQSTGKKSVVEGEIKTLADLKHYLDVNGISYPSECEFKEGKTKTIFVDNDAVLPTNVEWKGEVSDDLIMFQLQRRRLNQVLWIEKKLMSTSRRIIFRM